MHLVGCTIEAFFENRVLCEIMWKNAAEPDGSRMTVGRMHIACWIPKATDIHSQYVILIACPLEQWLHERASMLLYRDIACLAQNDKFHQSAVYKKCHVQ